MNDLYLIDINGIEEEIRCIICKNQIKTDKGCDGNCKYDESLFGKITTMLDRRIELLLFNQPEIVRCGDGCKFWNRHADGQVGTCDVLRQCTCDSFYCGNAKRREITT